MIVCAKNGSYFQSCNRKLLRFVNEYQFTRYIKHANSCHNCMKPTIPHCFNAYHRSFKNMKTYMNRSKWFVGFNLQENAMHDHDELDAHDDTTYLIQCTKLNCTMVIRFARLFAPIPEHSFESRNGNTVCPAMERKCNAYPWWIWCTMIWCHGTTNLIKCTKWNRTMVIRFVPSEEQQIHGYPDDQ